MTSRPFDFFGAYYKRFASDVAAEIRREVYGEDLGQTGWRNKQEQARIAAQLREMNAANVLDIACGSGGPSLALIETAGCRVTGVDIEEAGIAHAREVAVARGLDGKSRFDVVDSNKPLPFDASCFDAVICIDAINHLNDRFSALSDWARVLRPAGRLIFTDAAVLTGPISRDELDLRASQGHFVVVPPGVNEAAISSAGLTLKIRDDTTAAAAAIASALHTARQGRAARLSETESEEWFMARQRFLETTAAVAASRRLSRIFYVAEKPPQ